MEKFSPKDIFVSVRKSSPICGEWLANWAENNNVNYIFNSNLNSSGYCEETDCGYNVHINHMSLKDERDAANLLVHEVYHAVQLSGDVC